MLSSSPKPFNRATRASLVLFILIRYWFNLPEVCGKVGCIPVFLSGPLEFSGIVYMSGLSYTRWHPDSFPARSNRFTAPQAPTTLRAVSLLFMSHEHVAQNTSATLNIKGNAGRGQNKATDNPDDPLLDCIPPLNMLALKFADSPGRQAQPNCQSLRAREPVILTGDLTWTISKLFHPSSHSLCKPDPC